MAQEELRKNRSKAVMYREDEPWSFGKLSGNPHSCGLGSPSRKPLQKPGGQPNTCVLGFSLSIIQVPILQDTELVPFFQHFPSRWSPWTIWNISAGWWWLEHDWIIFPIILGMSYFQLTLSPWFFRGVGWNHQPVWFKLTIINHILTTY